MVDKEMGDIKPPSEYNSVSYRTLKVGTKSIKLTKYECDNTDTLYFGGHKKFCIDALVQKPGISFEERGIDTSNALLSHLYYDMNCSLESNFKRGLDSTMILKLCISYIKGHYPHIKTVSFTDTSNITCDDGQFVELSEMSYIRTGKTWYQTHFNAFLDSADELKFTNSNSRFQRAKQSITWKELKSYMAGKLPLDEIEMKKRYESATTWQDFFGSLSDTIGISKFCSFVAPWLHRFLTSEMRFYFSSMQYYIPVYSIESSDYDEQDYKTGGRRFTSKRYSSRRPRNEL